MNSNHVPMRKCIGCLKMKPKSELIRIVREPLTKKILIDKSGKKDGRGTYICKNKDCFKVVKKLKRIDRSFRCKISDELYEELNLYE